MRLPLSQIRTEDGTFSRAKINHSVVVEYARAISNGHHFPPIVVFFDGNCYFLADGFHRLEACRLLKYSEIEVELKLGTLREAILYAVGANALHGLRRTRADKQHAVTKLLEDEEWSQWSEGKGATQYLLFIHKIESRALSLWGGAG